MSTSGKKPGYVDQEHPFAIISAVPDVDEHRYRSAEEAKKAAVARSELTGYSYTVIQVIGVSNCQKTATWEGD